MGGPGSGSRSRLGAKATTDEFRSLDVRYFARQGLLSGFIGVMEWKRNGQTYASIGIQADQDQVVLIHLDCSWGRDSIDERYSVKVVHTPCHLGGTRAWFRCPKPWCGRRVAILYGGRTFACRHCYRLAYDSTRESWSDRAGRRAERLRVKLGWTPGILRGEGGKPKWMRWKTYHRIRDDYCFLASRALRGMMVELGLPIRD
jgi:hypothetical protein